MQTKVLDDKEMNHLLSQWGQHIHIVGIGGAGMSAIARVLLGKGFTVSGSDQQSNVLTKALVEAGATIYQGHAAQHIEGCDVLVISSAIPPTNPEVKAAQKAGIPVFKRADFLGQLMDEQVGVAIAGTHGKTTTTGMLAHVLLQTEQDPSVIVGGVLPTIGTNGYAGQGAMFVIEADEYDYTFLGLRPTLAVITNIEHDHPDIFATSDDYLQAFVQFTQLLPAYGTLIACSDDPTVQKLLAQSSLSAEQIITYGLETPASHHRHLSALDLRPNQLGGTDFLVHDQGEILGIARLAIPGVHNVKNALAVIAVALQQQIPFAQIVRSLPSFKGMGRRFEIIGEVNDITIIDDYGHHPTEIEATLAATKQRFPQRRIWAVWQPHTFTRTKLLLKEFTSCFRDADEIIVLDIYHSREVNDLGVHSAHIVDALKQKQARHIAGIAEAAQFLHQQVQPKDVVITLSAGDGNQVGHLLLKELSS